MSTYSDPALILPGTVGQTELDAASKKGVANGAAGLDASVEVPDAQLSGLVARIASGSFVGNNSANRAIPHGLGYTPSRVILSANSQYYNNITIQVPGWISRSMSAVDYHMAVTAADDTNFYVGNASQYNYSGNGTGITYTWVAFA